MRSVPDRNFPPPPDGEPSRPPPPRWLLREPCAGDIGWVVHRHGALYAAEYGWDWTFEALVARIAADFIERFDPARDCCRIAEAGGHIVGSAFVVGTDDAAVAKLRLVYVEPAMRGTGVAAALVEECMAFARAAGYRRMTLWTNDVLVPAGRLYKKLGFRLTDSEPLAAFGKSLVSETWERDL
jgi:GNAT superfamily N-acetyltransferase